MNEYSVEFAVSAARELRRLPLPTKLRIERAIDRLARKPHDQLLRKLKGFKDTYRIRVGDYRVVFEIYDVRREILITKVRHRRETYR